MKFFLINLDRRTDRLKFMETQFDNLGLKVERISAVDGRDLDSNKIKSIYDKKKALLEGKKELNLGEIGCTASHFSIYKKMIDDDISYAMIFEDDVKIDPKLLNYINNNEANFINKDFITFNYPFFDIKLVKKIFYWKKKLLLNKETSLISFFTTILGSLLFFIIDGRLFLLSKMFGILTLPYYRYMDLAGAYIISQNGARKILSLHDKVFVVIDSIFCNYGEKLKLRKRFVLPVLCKQDSSFYTDIQDSKN